MGMAFDHHFGEGDALTPGKAAPSGFDPIMLVIATASGCLFVTLLISCVCCSRRPQRHRGNAHLCSRRDTVPLEDLLSKPTLADPESFFSEAPLDEKDPRHAIGYWTNNDDTSVASMSQMSDLSTSELMSNDPGHTHAAIPERKAKSEKAKRSKNFQNRMLNNELRSSAKENRRQSDHIIECTMPNNTKIIVNNTQIDKLREDDFLYKNSDFDYINEINNTSSRRGNIDNKLKKTDNKDPSSTQRCLDVTTMAEDRVSSESFSSSARGSISHDMTASVNVLRLPRQSIIPQAESWSGSLLEESEKPMLSEVKEVPSPPISTPAVQFSLSSQNDPEADSQSIQSMTKSPDNNTAMKSSQDLNEALADAENTSEQHSVEIRPHIQDAPTLRHSPEGSQQVQSNCNNADQASGRIPERISVNLQIDFHFSDKAGCCGNQTRSYVVCSPVSVSQEMQEITSSKIGVITTSSSTEQRHFNEPPNSIADNVTCAIVQTDGSMSKELQPNTVTDNTNTHSTSHTDLACGENFSLSARTLDMSRKRFSTPIDFIAARGMNDIGLQSMEKRRFTVSDVADIKVVLKERTMFQLSQSRPSELLSPNQLRFIPSNTDPSLDQKKESNVSSQESHASKDGKDSEQIQKQQVNPKNSSQESQVEEIGENSSPAQSCQKCPNILPHEPITGNSVSDKLDSKPGTQNKIHPSFSTGPEADVDSSSNNNLMNIPNHQGKENSRHSNEENKGSYMEKVIAVNDSIPKEETKDPASLPPNIETDTRMEGTPSSLTPLQTSIQEVNKDIAPQSEEGPDTISDSRSHNDELMEGHFKYMSPANDKEPLQENENSKYLNDKSQCVVKDTPVYGITPERTSKHEMFQTEEYIENKGELAERHDRTCKDGASICSIDVAVNILESKGQNNDLKEGENDTETIEDLESHDYTCTDGTRICNNDTGSVLMESKGQNHALKEENRGNASEDVESKSDRIKTENDKMRGNGNTTEFDGVNDRTTSYKVKLSGDEKKRTVGTNVHNADDMDIKATHGTTPADCNRNILTSNQLVKNDSHGTKTKSSVGEAHVPQLNSKPAQEEENQFVKQKRSDEICKKEADNKSKYAKSQEADTKIVSKPIQKGTGIHENASNTLPTRLKDQKAFEHDGHKDISDNNEAEGEKPQLKGILRVNRSFDMTFKEQDNLTMNFYPVNKEIGSSTNKGQSEFRRHQNVAPFVFVSKDINVDKPAVSDKTEGEEDLLSPTISLPTTEDKSNASDESDYDNPWDSLDEAVKRGSMRYNRRASRVADGSDAKTLMLKSAEDLGRLLEDAERRRRMRQNAARSSCQIMDTTPPSPPPTFTRLSPFRHTVKGLVSHGSSKDLQDDALKSHPIKGKKDRQRSKDDLSPGLTRGIDPNRSKTIAAGERSKIYSPETKKRKGLLHRK